MASLLQTRIKLKLVILLLLVVALALVVWTFVIEPDRLVVREETIHIAAWPKSFDRLRIVALSDIHAGAPHIKTDKLRQLVAEVNRLQPDLIVILGDFVIQDVIGGDFIEPETIARDLKDLRARHGVYAVLGNHDWMLDGERVRRALEGVGIRVLENDVARIERDGATLWLAGLADLWTRKQDIQGTLRKIAPGQTVVALTHNPDIFPNIPSNVALTLAGHTHGGQVNLPLLGRPVVPSKFKQRYASGHIREDGRDMYVTSGVGTSIIPVRFRVAPEIVVLTVTAGS